MIDSLLLEPQGHDQSLNQQHLINQFTFPLIFVSPLRRTIQTAVNILKSHPQLDQGITLYLFPLCREIVNNVNDLTVTRRELEGWCENLLVFNPKIKIDFTYLDEIWT